MNFFPAFYFPYKKHLADEHHFSIGRPVWPPRIIVLHATGGTSSLDWLSTASPRTKPVSSHIYIDKAGTIYRVVEDSDTAWTQGPARIGPYPANGKSLNDIGLSVEMENLDDYRDPWPDDQILACATICIWWHCLYGAIPIVSHQMIQADKHDPAHFPWSTFYSFYFLRLRELNK